jgi:hypothetical protein
MLRALLEFAPALDVGEPVRVGSIWAWTRRDRRSRPDALRRPLDIEALEQFEARYFHTLDQQDWAAQTPRRPRSTT